jgi:chromosome segregation ATPase
MSAESRIQITVKLPSELHNSLSQAIKEGKYQNMTVAILTALEKELHESIGMSTDLPNQDSDIQRLTLELQKNVEDIQVMRSTFDDIQRLRGDKDKQLEEAQRQIKDLENSAREKSTEILRLQNVIQELPDRSDLAELKGLYEGKLQLIEEKDKRIEDLSKEVERLDMFAHYFKNVEVKQIEAPATEKKRWWKFW